MNVRSVYDVYNLTLKTGIVRVPLVGISARVIIRTVGGARVNGIDILDIWGLNSTDNQIDFEFPVIPDGNGYPIPYSTMLIFQLSGDTVGSVTVFRIDQDAPA